jgi:hypothetical protein
MNRSIIGLMVVASVVGLVLDLHGQDSSECMSGLTIGETRGQAASAPILEDKVIRMRSGSTRDDLLAKLRMKSDKAIVSAEMNDSSDSSVPGRVEFSYVGQKRLNKEDILLWFRASVDNFPTSLSVQRVALVKVDKQQYKVCYILTNVSGAPQLEVQGPALPLRWEEVPSAAAIDVISSDAAATDLEVSASSIVEKSGERGIDAQDLRLCKSKPCDAKCKRPSLLPHSRGSFVLCKLGQKNYSGEFDGKVVISAAEYPVGKAVDIRAFSSSLCARVWGTILLCLGVIAAWYLRTYVANRVTRDQALLGVALERQRVDKLMPSVKALNADFQTQEKNIYNYLNDLSVNKLTTSYVEAQLYITPNLPLPFQFSPRAAQFSAFLGQVDNMLNLLDVIIGQGLNVVWSLWSQSQGQNRSAFEVAISGLDSLFVQSPAPSVTQPQVAAILSTLRTSTSGVVVAAAVAPGPQSPVPVPSVSYLLLDIRRLSQVTWIAICVLTILAGWVVLIARNPGFGKPSDLVFCLFWGFGIPVTAQSLVPNSVLNAFGGSTMRVSATV